MIHDVVTSTMNLARVVRGTIDPRTTHTPVQNETLKLIIDTLIDLGTPAQHQKIAAESRKTVESLIMSPILDDRDRKGWL